MDINFSNNRANYSAINGASPKLPKTKGFGNFANSNTKAVGKAPSKSAVQKSRQKSKAAVLTYKQRLGQK